MAERSPRSVWSPGYCDVWRRDMEAAGHSPRLDDDGEIEMFVVDSNYCNGPGCESCGWAACMHCWGDKEIPPCTNPKTIEGVARPAPRRLT